MTVEKKTTKETAKTAHYVAKQQNKALHTNNCNNTKRQNMRKQQQKKTQTNTKK